MGNGRKLDEFIDESRASQRNIVFPDTVRNGRSVDVFLWHGSPNPSLVQRIGAWMFGLTFIVIGLSFFGAPFVTDRDYPWIFAVIGIPCVLVGMKIFRNGFPRRPRGEN